MKEYRKWVMGPASDDWVRGEFTGAEAAWPAALEWVLSLFRDNIIHDAGINVKEMIEEELKSDK